MKKFDVVLSKSYIISINAEDEMKAREFSEYYTSNISDISTYEDRTKFNFEIDEIDCKVNETYEVLEIENGLL